MDHISDDTPHVLKFYQRKCESDAAIAAREPQPTNTMSLVDPQLLVPPPACFGNSLENGSVDVSNTTRCRQGDSLLYVGADLDVHMLKLMQPWEREAIFVDPMTDHHGRFSASAQRGEGDSPLSHYVRRHHADRRPAWMQTSASFRPCTNLLCAPSLTSLLEARMQQDAGFSRVKVLGNLTLRFELRREPGLARTLRYVVADSEDVFQGPHEGEGSSAKLWGGTYASLHHRLSTLAMPGAAGNAPAHLMGSALRHWIPPCVCLLSVIAMRGEQDFVEMIGRVIGRHDALAYPLDDTLAGRRQLAVPGAPKLAQPVRTEREDRQLKNELQEAAPAGFGLTHFCVEPKQQGHEAHRTCTDECGVRGCHTT